MRGIPLEVTSVRAVLRRHLKAITAVIFVLIVVVQATFHMLATSEGRPYESFDEIATFNNAHVLVGPAADRTYRYGSMDTFLQWAAIVGYNHLTVTGASYRHIRYANAVTQSWDDPLLSQREKTWSGVDYNYFRGVDDRNPIFISRQFHLAFAYCIILAVGIGFISAFGSRAVYFIVPLLFLTVDPVVYYQAGQSLPNAINALLTFAIVLLAMVFADRFQDRYLILSAACFAIALNFKADVLVAGGAIGLALGLCLVQRGVKLALVSGTWAAFTFGAMFIATNPFFLAAPGHTLDITYVAMLNQMSSSPRAGYVSANISFLVQTLDRSFLWEGAGLGLVLAIAVVLFCLIGAAAKRTPVFGVLAIGAATTLVAWSAIVFRVYNVFDRYWLNGLGAFFATVAMGLLLAEREGLRNAARATLAVAALVYCVHATAHARHSFATYASYKESAGFSPHHLRTLASLHAIRTAKEPSYSQTVLVDQHAYIDLLPFRLAGVDARYVNMFSLQTVVANLAPGSKYLVVFGKGDYAPDQGGKWSPLLMQAYDAYQAQLARYPVLRHYKGRPQRLLSIGPISFSLDAEMTVAVLSEP